MLTLSPHPDVPSGAVMLALALLFGIAIFCGVGDPKPVSGGQKK